jgi:hypothetical protein
MKYLTAIFVILFTVLLFISSSYAEDASLKLKFNMSKTTVSKILGEPKRIHAINLKTGFNECIYYGTGEYYTCRGDTVGLCEHEILLIFINNKLSAWNTGMCPFY